MQEIHKPYKGLFITVEGGDGSGKTTLTDRLAEEMKKKGYNVLRTREPGGSPLSEKLRELILHTPKGISISERSELLLYLAARSQHVDEAIIPALRAGKVVICERFNDSSVAYQGGARHLGRHYVEELCKLASDNMEPQCTLLLDIDPKIGLERMHVQRGATLDRLESENLQFHKEVRSCFLHLADKYSDRICIIDGGQPPDKVLEDSLKAIEPHLMLKP